MRNKKINCFFFIHICKYIYFYTIYIKRTTIQPNFDALSFIILINVTQFCFINNLTRSYLLNNKESSTTFQTPSRFIIQTPAWPSLTTTTTTTTTTALLLLSCEHNKRSNTFLGALLKR